LTCNPAFQKLNNKLAENEGVVMAIIGDNYLPRNMSNTFNANDTFAEDLAEVVLALLPQKLKGFVREGHHCTEYDTPRGAIPNGILIDSNGDSVTAKNTPIFGIATCNIQIGSEAFIKGYIK